MDDVLRLLGELMFMQKNNNNAHNLHYQSFFIRAKTSRQNLSASR
jgi:hypothetical protein